MLDTDARRHNMHGAWRCDGNAVCGTRLCAAHSVPWNAGQRRLLVDDERRGPVRVSAVQYYHVRDEPDAYAAAPNKLQLPCQYC